MLKNLILDGVDFDKLYIIDPTRNQNNDLEYKIIKFIEDLKEIPQSDKLPENLEKLMIFDDVDPREQILKEYFCRGKHSNCNMIYPNQNLFSSDRQNVRENFTAIILFQQRCNVLQSKHRDFFNDFELSYKNFSKICNKLWREPYNYIISDMTKNKKY